MKIAIDISPLRTGHFLQHRVRGTGFYLENLKKSLLQYFPQNEYVFFTRGEQLPKDIDLVHYPYFEPFFLTLPLRKFCKTVVTIHDLTPLVFPKYFPAGIKGAIKWEIQKLILKKVDAIIADSESSKNDIIRHAGVLEKKIHVVYLAASQEFRKLSKEELRYKSKIIRRKYGLPEKFVLYVGDVTWNKNLPRLVEAIRKINVPLVMVGKALTDKNFDVSNPWNQDLAAVQEICKENRNIVTLGFVPTADVVQIYNLATVFTMPSLYEGFGLPVLEAMSCGCPVITTKEGSLEEVADDAAYYVDAYDVNSIASGIKKVFQSRQLQRSLSDKGLKRSSFFSWRKEVKETMKLYESALL